MQAKDYVVLKLTNVLNTDYSDAASTGFLDIRKLRYSEELTKAVGIPIEKFPDVHSWMDVIGEVTDEAARETGLERGTRVVAGGFDSVTSQVGAGAFTQGSMMLTLGGSMWGSCAVPHLLDDGNTHLVADPTHILSSGGNLATGGTCYEWLRDQLCSLEVEQTKSLMIDAYEIMDLEASVVSRVPKDSSSYRTLWADPAQT